MGLSISLIPEMVKFEDCSQLSSKIGLDWMTARGPCQLHCYLIFTGGGPELWVSCSCNASPQNEANVLVTAALGSYGIASWGSSNSQRLPATTHCFQHCFHPYHRSLSRAILSLDLGLCAHPSAPLCSQASSPAWISFCGSTNL